MKTTRLSIFPSLTLFLTSLTLLAVLSANAQVPSYVPTNGLVGYWPFNGNANDESGNGNNGMVNGATLTADRFGIASKAYDFVETGNQSIGIGDFDLVSNYSVSAWYKLNSFGGWHNIISKYGPSGGYAVIFDPSGALYSHTNNGTSSGDVCTSNYVETSDSWHLVTVTLDFGVFNFYVDGIAHGSCTSMNYSIPNDAITYFGRQSNGTGENLNGSLDDIGIWNRALSADEVLALYNGCNLTAQVIAGNITPGAFANSNYTCNNNAGSTYNWTVTNGVVVSGQGTNSVTILWGAEGVGSVTVAETTADGCLGDEVIYDVNVQCVVSGNEITGPVGPEAFSNSTYTCNGAANSTYNWTVTNGVIVSGQGTNSVSILWGAEGVGSVSVVETTAEGCVGDAVIYDVNVQCVVSGNTIEGPVGPEAFSNSTYTCNGAVNSTYNWTVINGVIVSGQGTNTVNILWASTGLGNVSVVETTAEGCVGVTLSQDVVVIPTNVEELSNAMILYPNPATTELNLQTTSDLVGTDLFVFDALGKQILKQQILSTNTRINTSAFAAGNYVVRVGGGVKKFTVEK
jgi:hypothetical protein